MILGILSLFLDYLLLNYFNYYIGNIIAYPMFTLVFLLSSIYFNRKRFCFFFLYSFINGIIFLPLLIMFLNYIIIFKKSFDLYILKITCSLILYDILLFAFLSLNNIYLLIYKILVTIPINILYSIIIYYVLKTKYQKYKLL